MNRSESVREKWAGLIREQRSSGVSVAAFCAGRGIAESSFYPWKRRLGAVVTASPGSAFVEARIRGVDAEPRGAPAGRIAIELACGRRLLVGRGFDRDLLREVIEALESCAAPDPAVTPGAGL